MLLGLKRFPGIQGTWDERIAVKLLEATVLEGGAELEM